MAKGGEGWGREEGRWGVGNAQNAQRVVGGAYLSYIPEHCAKTSPEKKRGRGEGSRCGVAKGGGGTEGRRMDR